MHNKIAKTVGTVGALGALALGGSALADAASTTTTTSSGAQTRAAQKSPTDRRANGTTPGGHKGANGKTETALSADTAANWVSARSMHGVSGGGDCWPGVGQAAKIAPRRNPSGFT